MRKWSVSELESLEADMDMIQFIVRDDFNTYGDGTGHLLDSKDDCTWLAERIIIRASHGEHVLGVCDACPDGATIPVVTCVDEYPDDMGAPSTLGVSFLCRYHVRNNYDY